jgi:hypothetical protein
MQLHHRRRQPNAPIVNTPARALWRAGSVGREHGRGEVLCRLAWLLRTWALSLSTSPQAERKKKTIFSTQNKAGPPQSRWACVVEQRGPLSAACKPRSLGLLPLPQHPRRPYGEFQRTSAVSTRAGDGCTLLAILSDTSVSPSDDTERERGSWT